MRKNGDEKRERFSIPAEALFGNIAVDLDRLPQTETNGDSDEQRKRRDTRKGAHTRVGGVGSQLPSTAAVLGCAVLAIMTVLLLLANVRLTEVTAQYNDMTAQIEELSERQRQLTVNYELAFNPAQIRDYAVLTLGMTQPSRQQIIELDAYTQDKAVVLSPTLGHGDRLRDIADFIRSLVGYLG